MRGKKMPAIAVISLLCAVLIACAKPEGAGAVRTQEKKESAQAEETKEKKEPPQVQETQEKKESSRAEKVQEEIPSNSEIFANGYEEREAGIFEEELTDRTALIRFYKEAPNVAYMGISQYFDLMLGGGLKVQDQGDGKYLLTNAAGAEALADTGKGTVSIDDLPTFENYYDEAREGIKSSFKDSNAPYLRLREVVYEGEPEPVVFDLGSLGIRVYGDGNEVWLPVSILSSWLTDIAQNRIVYNGRYLYICRDGNPYSQDSSCFDTDYYDQILTGADRADDLAAYTYGDLGFIFRYMYGYPGRTGLDDEILRNEGFDKALEAFGEEGRTLREELTSKNFSDFWYGMFRLSEGPLEDGHNITSLEIGVVDMESTEKYQAFREYTWDKFADQKVSPFLMKMSQATSGIYEARPEEYGESKYYRSGDTAVILLDGFNVDEAAWSDYYMNGGDLPNDAMGIAARGLNRAAQDGVSNVLFDVSTNPGGYSDSVAGVLSLMTGRDYLCGYNELSKQSFRIYFDIDRNLDGKIDEKDDEVNYDFNYAVLTSNASFSCGNMFPFLVRDEGGMVIGERSGGGSCSIQKAVLSEGFEINISGCKFKLTDHDGDSLENGVAPDIGIEVESQKSVNEITGEETEQLDYSKFGNMEEICSAVSEWFSE